jgi:hypothetical protein
MRLSCLKGHSHFLQDRKDPSVGRLAFFCRQLHTRANTKTRQGLGHWDDDGVMKDVAEYVKTILN